MIRIKKNHAVFLIRIKKNRQIFDPDQKKIGPDQKKRPIFDPDQKKNKPIFDPDHADHGIMIFWIKSKKRS